MRVSTSARGFWCHLVEPSKAPPDVGRSTDRGQATSRTVRPEADHHLMRRRPRVRRPPHEFHLHFVEDSLGKDGIDEVLVVLPGLVVCIDAGGDAARIERNGWSSAIGRDARPEISGIHTVSGNGLLGQVRRDVPSIVSEPYEGLDQLRYRPHDRASRTRCADTSRPARSPPRPGSIARGRRCPIRYETARAIRRYASFPRAVFPLP